MLGDHFWIDGGCPTGQETSCEDDSYFCCFSSFLPPDSGSKKAMSDER